MALPGMGPDIAHGQLPDPYHRGGAEAEWPGAVGARFADKLTGKPTAKTPGLTDVRGGYEGSLARQGLSAFFEDKRGLIQSTGLKRIPQDYSEAHEWRPGKRSLSAPGGDHFEKPEGRRGIEPAPSKPFLMREKRHLRQVESKEEHADRPAGLKIVHRPNGVKAKDQPAREVDITHELQRKARALDVLSQRNGIGVKIMGDKAYRHPEYADNFYKMGNLQVGSGFVRGTFKRTEARNSTSLAERRNEPKDTFETLCIKKGFYAPETSVTQEPIRQKGMSDEQHEAMVQKWEVETRLKHWEATDLKERMKHELSAGAAAPDPKAAPAGKDAKGGKDAGGKSAKEAVVEAMWKQEHTYEVWENLDSDDD
jgi:hypothetical protein